MVKKTFLVLICLIGLIIIVSSLHGQGSKKTITLPNGEVVCDLNGEWEALYEYYGLRKDFGSYPQIVKITQEGNSLVGIRMMDDPYNPKGWEALRGELDQSGFKKVQMIAAPTYQIDAKGIISDDGNKMEIDNGENLKVTLTRK
jgi:hypothetical protein